jgi:hypothetical protein
VLAAVIILPVHIKPIQKHAHIKQVNGNIIIVNIIDGIGFNFLIGINSINIFNGVKLVINQLIINMWK